MEISNKVVVVTGGARGIGAALCRRFHEAGAAGVAVLDRDADGAARVASEIGGLALEVDVASESALTDAVARIRADLGPIDLFCSNAGVLSVDPGFGPAAAGTDEDWARSWQINVMSHVYAARAVLPEMLQKGSGYLLQTASAAGLLSQIGSAVYSTTKHAAIGFAESLAIAYGDRGIGVSVLAPQAVETDMIAIVEDGGVAGLDGVLSPAAVADCVISGLAEERFLILPHPEVREYWARKSADVDRWLSAMRRLRDRFADSLPQPD